MSFQSRFGPDEWLQPYTDKTVQALAGKRREEHGVVAPGFTADCLETLEEIDVENREIFMHHGGEQFAYVPCLNDSADGMEVIQARGRPRVAGLDLSKQHWAADPGASPAVFGYCWQVKHDRGQPGGIMPNFLMGFDDLRGARSSSSSS